MHQARSEHRSGRRSAALPAALCSSPSLTASIPRLGPAGKCYFDCVDDASCLHSLALENPSDGTSMWGAWHRVSLPAQWTAVSLLFTSPIVHCASATPSPFTSCVRFTSDGACDTAPKPATDAARKSSPLASCARAARAAPPRYVHRSAARRTAPEPRRLEPLLYLWAHLPHTRFGRGALQIQWARHDSP